MYTLEGVQKRKTREIVIQTTPMKMDEATIGVVERILKEHKGSTPVKVEFSELSLASHQSVRVQMQLAGGLNIQNGGVGALRAVFGEGAVMPLGPNRRMKRVVVPVAETPLLGPSEEMET